MKQIQGIDYILGGNYVKTILEAHPPGYAAGFLWNVSWVRGSKRAIIKLAQSGKCPAIRVSLIWHDNHTFTRKDIRRARKKAKKLAKIVKRFPGIEWYCQPMLEPHGASEELTLSILKAAKQALPPQVTMVSGNHYGGPKVLKEGHHRGYHNQQIFSFDGLDCLPQHNPKEWKMKARQAHIFFLWCAQCNGNATGEKVPRWRRRNWLEPFHIRSMVRKYR